MTTDQILVFGILLATLAMFVWGRWRYDIVSAGALLLVFLFGLVPTVEVFLGFGHPAVITVATVAALMAGTMLLSNVVNNAAAAVLMAPIAINLAAGMEISVDPLLMATAIGASCAFLTPVGHQSNALVMAPAGYRFGDYWRLGLHLSILVVAVAVPLICLFWRF